MSGKRRRIVIIITFVAIFAVLSLPLEVSRSMRKVVTGLFSPVLSVCRSITGKLADIWNVTFHGDNIVRESLRKEREILRLRAELALEREKARQLESLRRQLQEARGRGFRVIPARIIGREPDSWYQTLLINRGRKHGVGTGMAVVHGENLLGRVIEVGGGWSRARLILDARSAVPVATVNGDVPGMVIGSGPSELKMTLIRHNATVEVGEEVVTTHLRAVLDQESSLPQGLVVGTISRISYEQDGLYQSATLKSKVNFRNLREVLVVISK